MLKRKGCRRGKSSRLTHDRDVVHGMFDSITELNHR